MGRETPWDPRVVDIYRKEAMYTVFQRLNDKLEAMTGLSVVVKIGDDEDRPTFCAVGELQKAQFRRETDRPEVTFGIGEDETTWFRIRRPDLVVADLEDGLVDVTLRSCRLIVELAG